MLTDIQGKLRSHPALFDHSLHLTQIFRRFASGEILWPLLIRVTPHRAAACITFGNCFKPKNGLGWFLQILVLLLNTVSCREQPGLSYCCGCRVKGESFQTKGLQNKSPFKFIARNQNHTAVFLLGFPRFSWELCKYFKHQNTELLSFSKHSPDFDAFCFSEQQTTLEEYTFIRLQSRSEFL